MAKLFVVYYHNTNTYLIVSLESRAFGKKIEKNPSFLLTHLL